jgi:hypothetical protein
MVVALIALVVAIGGTAAALPGKFTVGRDDLKNGSVGARSIGKILTDQSQAFPSKDAVAGDGIFTESTGTIRCPAKAPTAIDPQVGGLGPQAFEVKRNALSNRFGGPLGYEFTVSSDQGPDVGYTMKVNCLFAR